MNVDKSIILRAMRSSIPLTIKTHKFPPKTAMQLERILRLFLREMRQEELCNSLFYCIRELIMNAQKANTKRVYFKEINLNINDDEEYKQGMQNFKQEIVNNQEAYLDKQQEAGLYIKIIFHIRENILNIYIINNSEITVKEQKRVYDRIARSRVFNSFEAAFSAIQDDSEGAGLGITMVVLMLNKMGLDEDSFDIDVENGETLVRVSIPMDDVHVKNINEVSEELINQINNIPQFPENITALQADMNNTDVAIQDIARRIAVDPALTAEILKTANSAAFMRPKRIDNIAEAVKLIGLRSLRKILYTYGAQAILTPNSGEARELWDHCYRTAFYSYTIASGVLRRSDILDDVYVGGILHDIGKIVFNSAHTGLISIIKDITQRKGIPAQLLESFTTGLNHAEIGGRLAEKWNFPDVLIESIRYHHNPQNADPAYQLVTSIIYIANSLANIDESTMDYEQINPVILNILNIPTLENLKRIHEVLLRKFASETQKQ